MALPVVFSLRSATGSPQDFLLYPGIFVLGRSLTCDLIVRDLSVSRQHARIEVGEGSCRIIDLGSHNGSFVDDARSKPPMSTQGKRFVSGKLYLHFSLQKPSKMRSERNRRPKVGTTEKQFLRQLIPSSLPHRFACFICWSRGCLRS